jgi:hypothetical protein
MKRRKTSFFAAALVFWTMSAANAGPHPYTIPASPQQRIPSVRFALGGNAAEIPAEFIDNLVFLPVRVNSTQPCLFLLDSSSALTSIDPVRASELAIHPDESVSLDLPGVTLSLAVLPQVARPNFGAEVGRVYEGTLGRDFFESVVIEIDYARKTVRLYDPTNYQYSGKAKPFHMSSDGTAPELPAKFSTMGGKSLDGIFSVDTALDASILFYGPYADAHRLFAHLRGIPSTDYPLVGGEGNDVLGRLKTFEIGNAVVQGPIADFSKSNPAAESAGKISGEIGGGMLRRFNVVFDCSREQVFLDSNLELHSDEIEDMSGVAIIAQGPGLRKFEVTEVRRGTPGHDAGLQEGDIIAGIDEDPAADLSLAEIRGLFKQLGHPYKLTVERNGQTITLTLKLRRLL